MSDADAQGSRKIGRLLLPVAAVVALGSIAYAVMHGASAPKSQNAAGAPAPAPAPTPDPDTAVAELQKHVHENPKDVDAWRKLGWMLHATGRDAQAVAAYAHAVELAPGDATTWSSLGEALVAADIRNPMPDAAVKAFTKAIALNPNDPRARYYLAVRRDLAGDHKGAIDAWFALLHDTKPGAPWERDLVRTILRSGQTNHIDVGKRLAAIRPEAVQIANESAVATAAIPGPTREQIASGNALPREQQDAMISAMVARLEAKLQDNSGDVDGWIMLMRSRMTLNDKAKAGAALKAAIAANPARQDYLREQARLIGVPGA